MPLAASSRAVLEGQLAVDAATSPHSRTADIVAMSNTLAAGFQDGESFESCMFNRRELVSATPLQRWDPEVPQASAEACELLAQLSLLRPPPGLDIFEAPFLKWLGLHFVYKCTHF